MKKLPLFLATMLTLPAYGQSILSSLNTYQETLTAPSQSTDGTTSSSGTVTDEVKPDEGGTSSSTKQCTSNTQSSLPLTYVTSLIMEKNGKLDILHDKHRGEVSWSAPKMIGNCSGMIDWKFKKPMIDGKQAYAIEAAIKPGEDCTDAGCSYHVKKLVDGVPQNIKITLKPDLKGFEECLKQTGVVVDGKVQKDAIFPQQLKEKRSGVDQTGKLFFLSSGLMSSQTGGKYGPHEYIDGCDHYETAHPNIKSFINLADAEKERLDAEAAALRECKVDEYGKLTEFIENYQGYADELGEVRDRLIMEAAKKAAANIESGKYTDDDLKVIADFHKYVVEPKVNLAVDLYDAAEQMEGDSQKAAIEQLNAVLGQLKILSQKPYFTSLHTQKLMNDGKFEDAVKMNDSNLVLQEYQKIGFGAGKSSPKVAAEKVVSERAKLTASLPTIKENHLIKTGQLTTKSAEELNDAETLRGWIQERTYNYNVEMMKWAQRIQQPNGYCYKYWRNTQKCIQESLAEIQRLQADLQFYNGVDEQRAKEHDVKAKDYQALEAEGRKYIAAQNGEPVPTETTPEVDTRKPATRPETNPGVYTFDFNPNGQGQPNPQLIQQQAQMTPQMYQYPANPYAQNNMFQQQQNPYGIYGQNQSFMGQQSYGYPNQMGYQMQGSYNFQMGGGMQNQYGYGGYQQQPAYGGYQQFGGYPQQQQGGYWNNPYQAYNMNSIYGRTW